MRILHTADWHVGKKLGRIDRSRECERVLDEVVGIARSGGVDLVIVAGDLFDRALPPFDSLGLVLRTLARLAETAPVIAIPGNHDSAALFGVLAPYLQQSRVHIADKIRRPHEGGVIELPSRDGKTTARVACMPFLHETQTVDFIEATEEWYKSYADRVRKVTSAYGEAMAPMPGTKSVDVLVGHFMVDGAIPSGSERELHIGEAFMATSAAIPPGIKYGALGHIHLTQRAPGSDHAWYAGSLMQLDFGEAGHDKYVLIADVSPDKPGARVEQVPITSGRTLHDVTATLDELRASASTYGDDILRVTVTTEGPEPGLADAVRELLPNALYVKADYERDESERPSQSGRPLHELYADYHQHKHGVAPSGELMAAFNELAEEVGVHS